MKVVIALSSCVSVLCSLVPLPARVQDRPEPLPISICQSPPGVFTNTVDQQTSLWGEWFGHIAQREEWSIVKTNALFNPARLHFTGADGQQAELLEEIDDNLAQFMVDADSDYEAKSRQLESARSKLWRSIRRALQDFTLYLPVLGMGAFLLWNRRLSREVKLRQQTENRFQALADNSPGVIYQYLLRQDGSDALLYVSSRCYEVWGVDAAAAVADVTRLWLLVHPDDLSNMRASVFRSARSLQPWNYEWRIVLPDGTQKWLQASAIPLSQENGDVMWDGFAIDVSERKAAEIALRRSESRFQKLADNVPGILYGYRFRPDETDEFTYISSGFEEIYGISPDLALRDSQVVWGMTHPDDTDRVKRATLESYQTLQVWRAQYRVITPTGELKWLQGIARPTQQENGDVIWDGLIVDISDRKQAELALQTSESRLNTLISSLPGFVYRVANNSDYTAEFISQGVFEILGYQPQDLMNRSAAITLGELLHPSDRERVWNLVQRALQFRNPYECEYRMVNRFGQVKWVWERGQGIFDDQGNLCHLEGFVTEISDRKRAELALQASEARYRQVVEAQTDFILRSRSDTTITFANEALCRALGVSLEQIVGKKWIDIVNPDDLQKRVFAQLALLNPQNPRCFVENRDTRANGEIGWTQWLNEGVFDDAGQLIEIQSVGRDITQLKQIETALRESEERLRLVTENMRDLVCLHHIDGQFVYVTPSSQSLLGYLPGELIGRYPNELIHPEDRDRVRRQIYEPGLEPQFDIITYRIRHHNGDYIWLETLAKPIFDGQGQILHLQTTSRNVSDRIRAEQQLMHDALYDGLTNLSNRNRLMHRLDLALERLHRKPDFQFAVIFLDLDNFKLVNDSLGHMVGDELLIAVAHHLQGLIRETDLGARLGGDEFVLLVEEIGSIHEAVCIAERILEELRSPVKIADRDVFISTSIGIVAGDSSHQCAADLLRDADLAMYRAKHSGRAQYAIFDPMMHLQVMRRLHLEQDLRKALEKDEFVLFYQPIVALDDLQVMGFEALIRWQHTERGLISPLDFIPVAEETGLIVEIGRWTLNTACQQLARWQTEFPERDLKVSINLSVQQLQSSLVTHLREALTASHIAPSCLVLELTESMLVKNIEMTQSLLEEIREMGIRLSIDDFGTGYSSLSYLNKLPVDTLKIDRAFVSFDEPDARNHLIAESIIALSNLLELGVIAEGIQKPEQLEWLKKLGCKLGQGFLFSAPLPAAQATQLLRQRFFAPVPNPSSKDV